jgi:IclR family KDG regulon transcriptional repressor
VSEITPISAVVTTLSIIEAMAGYGDPIGVSDLAKLVNENKPRTYRHLRTLVDQDYVTQDAETDKYFLSLKLFHIGQSIAVGTSFVKEARQIMPSLRLKTGQTVTIGQVEEHGVRILDILKHRSDIEIATPPGTLFDFHSSAQGKIAMAFGPKSLLDGVAKKKLKRHTDHTCTDTESLKFEVAKIARQGFAVAPEEALMGVNALAAPIFDAAAELAGTITIVGSIQHLPATPPADIIAAVIDAAANVSARLGYLEVASA